MLSFVFDRDTEVAAKACAFETLIVAGWTGRDTAALEHHIEELAKIGVPRPSSTPVFYRTSVNALTQSSRLEVLGPHTSGEVEPVLFGIGGELWLGIGSDHTDRKAEAMGIALSKQLCGKPVGNALWRYADVAGHWDSLVIRAWATIDGQRVLYQQGTLASMRRPEDLLTMYGLGAIPHGAAMFCGTVGAIGGIRPAQRFEMELEDPIQKRSLKHSYDVIDLPVVS